MSFNYDSIAAISLELLTEYGQSVTRTSYSAGTYNPATGSTTPTTATTTRKGALFSFDGGTTQVRGTMIANGDKQLLLDAEGAVSITDHYTIGGTEYTVVSIDETNPAGTAVINELHLRLA